MSLYVIQRFYIVSVLFLVLGSTSVLAQVTVNTDSLFLKAQVQAKSGNYTESRQLLKQVLLIHPDYTDASLLTGRTYAWEQKFDSARFILEPLLARDPYNTEILLALADVELWSGNYEKAITLAATGLDHNPDAVPLLLVKARALQQERAYSEADQDLVRLLELEPENAQALQLLDQVRDLSKANLLRADYQVTAFNKDFSAWQLGMLEYTRITPKGRYLGRVSYANRYEQQSIQLDADAYPRLNKNAYLYLNAGFSDGNLFPEFRAGAELYHALPYKFEASAGARLLAFKNENVMLYTGYIGKYFKKQWVSFRPFFQNIDGEWQTTGILLIRQYLGHEENHISLVLSKGSTPLMQVGLDEIDRLDASRVGFESQFRLGKNYLVGGLFSFEYEEYLLDSFRNRYTFGLSVQRKF